MEQEKNFSAETKLDLPESALTAEKKEKTSGDKSKKNKPKFVFIWILIIIVVLLLAGFLVNKYTNINLFGSSLSTQNNFSNDYSAVFLSNGQVYFGIIDKGNHNDDYTILRDIYYLQVSNPLQQVPPNGKQQQPQLTLVKLGNELHAPEDYMQINNRQIIFIEKLKPSGKVVQAIKQYKKGGQKEPAKK